MSLDDEIRRAEEWARACRRRQDSAWESYEQMKREDYQMSQTRKRFYEECAEETRRADEALAQLRNSRKGKS